MINVLLNTQTRECVPDNTLLGFEEDNDSNKIAFRFADGFIDGLARLYIRKGDKKGNVELQKEGESYVLPVKRSLFISTGVIEFQLTMYNGEDVVASYDSFGLLVKDKIITDEPLPEELPSWIDDYNAKILEVNEAIANAEEATATANNSAENANNSAENAENVAENLLKAKENGEFNGKDGEPGKDGKPGKDGEPGFSPSAKVEQTDKGALITITDEKGTTTAEVLDGKNDMVAFELKEGNLYIVSKTEEKLDDYKIINGELIVTIE